VRLGPLAELLLELVFPDGPSLHLPIQVDSWRCTKAERMSYLL